MNIGTKIHNLRTDAGLTLQELGDKVGVGASTVRKWETSYIKSLGHDKIHKLAAALGTTPDYLLGETNNSVKIDTIHSNNGVIGQNSGEIHIVNGRELSKEESELLRVFNSLDIKRRTKLMCAAYDLEEEMK